MIRTLLVSTALVAFTAFPGIAGNIVDPVVEPAPVMPAYEPETDWSGFYAGVNGVYGVVLPPNVDYYGGGVHAGYLHDMGDFVVGGEVNYEYIVPSAGPPQAHRIGADVIAGYDAGMVLPHVTAGVSGLSTGGPFTLGVSAGAGLSIMASDNVILTGRYRYTYYNAPGWNAHAGKLMVSFKF